MKPRDGLTTPIWAETTDCPKRDAPPPTLHADTIVVGAGISGLTTA